MSFTKRNIYKPAIKKQILHTIMHWRSLLFVPAHEERFINSCINKGASAIALDLEDSVPENKKQHARQNYQLYVALLRSANCEVCVRINSDLRACVADLEVVVITGTAAIVVPKVIGIDQLILIDELILKLEQERDLPENGIALIAMVESAQALQKSSQWGEGCSRLAALFFGTEDFCLDTGMQASPENLFYPAQQLVLAAKSIGVLAFGFPASIADYSNLSMLRASISSGKSMGFDGVFCIHPKQVDIVYEVYQPIPAEIDQAGLIVKAYELGQSQGKGAVEVAGKMIDAPVYHRAKKLLSEAFIYESRKGS
jgi:citrate lyase subunit beta/citryl-CoA lyase